MGLNRLSKNENRRALLVNPEWADEFKGAFLRFTSRRSNM
jgi:hypothetical protein